MALQPMLHEPQILSVGAELNYREDGQILGCPVGAAKSRVPGTLDAASPGFRRMPARHTGQ
jgi:DNA-directed RNA polymerase specialized sigma24 family protein